MNNVTRLRRGNYALTLAGIAALPYRSVYADLSLAQRRRAAQFQNAKLKRQYLACKWLQLQLRQQQPKHHFSMSHTGKWVVIASARRRIGIDAERAGDKISSEFVKLIAANPCEGIWAAADTFTGPNRSLLLWLAKEARFKSAGNFQANFDPQTIAVYGASGWLPKLRFERVWGLQIAVYLG